MADPASPRRRPDPDPSRKPVVEVRRGLFRLHKTLIDAERAVFERERGNLTSGEFLQALIQDPELAWLQPFTRLIVEMDEVLATREPIAEPEVRALLDRARLLIEPESGSDPAQRYQEIRERNPETLLLHIELTQRIETGLESL
jgi:hypothetical protein